MSEDEPRKCDFCGEDTKNPLQCDFCKSYFCEKHQLPQRHKCVEMRKLEQEARAALLQHNSSKSSNQAIIILTLALAFFTGFQATRPDLHSMVPMTSNNILFWLVGSVFCFLMVRAVGRLLWFGYQAEAVSMVKLVDEDEVSEWLEDNVRVPKIETTVYPDRAEIELVATYLKRLEWSCCTQVERRIYDRRMSGWQPFAYVLTHEMPWLLPISILSAYALTVVWQDFLLLFSASIVETFLVTSIVAMYRVRKYSNVTPQRKCPKCGAEIVRADVLFCKKCGNIRSYKEKKI